ncbi:outer membrane beta-barrel family protein [Adhaeribacter soli]|uniref:TonB-dependent receptor n=1 Tax=Adhaeribacter soli TaxID=2607655 RepID=A0A5N1J4T5_9BACT|nr:outer membrane beta-barrel family protein [Adhaeribacter soli]KAA9345737.1 TonB-dependent receptor [Adhaeribacter soli]
MKKIKLILCLFSCLGIAFTGFAQSSTPQTGSLKGKIQESGTREPVSFATVALLTLPDSAAAGGVSADEQGNFIFPKLPYGKYILKISMVGYATKRIPNLQLSENKPALDLGTIQMLSNTKTLSGVEIVGQKNLVEYGLDKQVLNVAKDLSSVGGTASDALKNAPSVAVDIDGNVSVRGSSNITVLVDGKNTGQSAQTILSQTPASAIERIEVITNPSAKYDAEGMGGIINIILKKDGKKGLNGNAALNLGTYDNHNASLNLNYRYKKFNFFTGYDGMQNSRRGIYELDRSTTYQASGSTTESTTYLEQRQKGRRQSQTHIPKLGFDYNFSEKESITLSAKLFGNSWNERETVNNFLQNDTRPEDISYTRLGNTENGIDVIDYAFSYRRAFALKGQEVTASAVYTTINGHFDRFYHQFNTDANWNNVGGDSRENFLQEFNVKPFFAQADYVHPIGEKGKVETGAKRSQRVLNTEFRGEEFDYDKNEFVLNELTSNKFGYSEFVNAGYVNYGNTWKKLSYQVGVRAEQTEIIVTDKGNDKKYRNPYFNLFPSAFLSQEINENLKLQLNYSRRINRPNYEALNPFVNYSDPLNIWYGNPFLKPEYIDSYEGSYLKFWNSGSLTATGFYRQVHNVIQQVRQVVNADVANNTYVNLNDGSSYGLEMSGSQALAKWFKLSGNASAFNYKVSGTPLGVEANSSKFSWLGRLNANVTLPKNISAQVSVNYRSPQALAQGTRAAIYNTDFSIKKDVLNKKGSVTFRVSDIFNTLKWDTNIKGKGLVYDLHMKRQTRIATLGFAYRFGEQEKRRRTEAGNSLEGMF